MFSFKSPLWRERDFLRLWAAQSVSDFGARITREGLPIMAVVTLAAKPGELGVLAALSSAAGLLVGLTAGDYVDHTPRRRILILTDLLRALVLLSVPIAALFGVLSMPQVYAVAVVVAAASVLFAIADHAYLPSLVGKPLVLDANANISATESVAEMATRPGRVVPDLSAPFAIAVNGDVCGFGGLLARHPRGPPPETHRQRVRRRTVGRAAGARAVDHDHRRRLFGGLQRALHRYVRATWAQRR